MDNAVWYLAGEIEESGPTRHVPINVTPFQIGRRSDIALSLPCLTVSKLHAELVKHGPDLLVRDLDSLNGTYINGQRVHLEEALSDGDLVQFGNVVFEVGFEETRAESHTVEGDVARRAQRIREFDRLMTDRAVLAFFQPIVGASNRKTVGYEVLGRSRLFGLDTPQAMFQAASMLKVESELSRILRMEGIQASIDLPGDPHLFFNTHPMELDKRGLLESMQEIRDFKPNLPLTLEIHEAMVVCPNRIAELREALRELGVTLAYDDFGAGQSRLLELFAVRPEYVKFDMRLVQGIHQASEQTQHMLATLVRMVRDAGIVPVAEGVECEEDAVTCTQVGFELAQGFHFGRPALARDCVPRRR